jgi:hypothetical protein
VTRSDCIYTSTGTPSVNTISFTVSAAINPVSTYTIQVGPILNPSSCVPANIQTSFIVGFSGGSPTGTISSGLRRSYSPGALTGTLV